MMPIPALVLLVACLGMASPVQAQPTPIAPPWATPESVEAKLRSNESSEVAWGAFLAAEYQLKSAIPLMVDRLTTTPSEPDRNRQHHLTAALLDSLIQLDARVAGDVLLPFYSDWPIHTLVLLGSAAESRDSSLVALLGGATGYRWYAVANLLLETKPPGFAAALLRHLSFTLTVTVSEPGNNEIGDGVGGGTSGGSRERAEFIAQLPAGFPPYAHYSFGGVSGARVLALGPVPVYYMRIVRNTFQYPIWSNARPGPTASQRIRYLEELLQLDERPSLRIASHASVRWGNVEGFKANVQAARRELVEQYERFVAALLRRQRLTEAEARILPAHIDVSVWDARLDRSIALPGVD